MGIENLETHRKSRIRDIRSLLGSEGSLNQLNRILHPVANNKFVRYLNQDAGGEKDERDIYRDQAMSMVFTHDRWDNHRSTWRYAKHLMYMFNSNVFKALLGPVFTVMVISIFVGLYETLLKNGVLPESWPHVQLALGQAFNLTAFALSLLLVFRTNSSYDRWWEARKLWGGVVNRTRDVVRQSLVFFRDEDVHLRELLARWTMALPVVLMVHLRSGMDLQTELQNILPPEEVAALLAAQHRPNMVLQVLAEVMRSARPEVFLRVRMDENLSFFEDAMGSMERILRTPIPLSYTRHTSRFLLIWLLMLPFTMWAAYSWSTVLLSAIFAFLMLGIDEIGVQIEEPFGVLPIEAYCQTIERNIRELLSRNFNVRELVLRQNYPIGSAAMGPMNSDNSAGLSQPKSGSASGASGDDDEFGELTGAPGQSPVVKQQLGGAHVVSLTANAGFTPGPAAGTRRVRFAEQPGGGGGAPERDMIEIELGPAGDTAHDVPLMGVGAPRSSYAVTWLQQ